MEEEGTEEEEEEKEERREGSGGITHACMLGSLNRLCDLCLNLHHF